MMLANLSAFPSTSWIGGYSLRVRNPTPEGLALPSTAVAPTLAEPGEQPDEPQELTGGSGRQVFVGAGSLRAWLVRWTGRGIGLVVMAYLVLLGASLARAPWAPRISLPGLGPVTPPVLHVSPPSLGSRALTTPVPPAVLEAGTAPSQPPGSNGGSNPSVTSKPAGSPTTPAGAAATSTTAGAAATSTTAGPPGLSKQTTTTAPGTTTTRSTPSATAPGRTTTTTTTAAGSTTSTSRGRSGSHP